MVRQISLGQYCRRFKSRVGILAGIVTALPALSGFLPDSIAHYVFPPLSDRYRFALVVLAVLVFLCVFWRRDLDVAKNAKGRFRAITGATVVSAIGAVLFVITDQVFVRSIPVPTVGKTVAVSVGFERTKFAMENFPNASDWEVLHARGWTEEEIRKVWTLRSIVVARLALFLTYMVFFLAALIGLSRSVLFDCLEEVEKPGRAGGS